MDVLHTLTPFVLNDSILINIYKSATLTASTQTYSSRHYARVLKNQNFLIFTVSVYLPWICASKYLYTYVYKSVYACNVYTYNFLKSFLSMYCCLQCIFLVINLTFKSLINKILH